SAAGSAGCAGAGHPRSGLPSAARTQLVLTQIVTIPAEPVKLGGIVGEGGGLALADGVARGPRPRRSDRLAEPARSAALGCAAHRGATRSDRPEPADSMVRRPRRRGDLPRRAAA